MSETLKQINAELIKSAHLRLNELELESIQFMQTATPEEIEKRRRENWEYLTKDFDLDKKKMSEEKQKITAVSKPSFRLPDLAKEQDGWYINGIFVSREDIRRHNRAYDIAVLDEKKELLKQLTEEIEEIESRINEQA